MRCRASLPAAVPARFVAAFTTARLRRSRLSTRTTRLPLLHLTLRVGALLLARGLRFGPVLRPILLALGPLLLRRAAAVASLLGHVLSAIAPLFVEVLAVAGQLETTVDWCQ